MKAMWRKYKKDGKGTNEQTQNRRKCKLFLADSQMFYRQYLQVNVEMAQHQKKFNTLFHFKTYFIYQKP